jgi:glycosyltransferase involved in cell wall biosynthesis
MRIGLFARHISMRGGIGTYSRGLIGRLIEQCPQDEFFLYYSQPGDLGLYARFGNVQERSIPASNKLIWDQWTAPRAAQRDRVDIILNTKLSAPLFSRIPSIFVFHGPEMYAVPEAYTRLDLLQGRLFYPRFARRAAATVVSTADAQRMAQKHLGLSLDRAHIIPPGRDEHFYPSTAQEVAQTIDRLGIPRDFLLFVGGLYPVKNFRRLLLALKILRDRRGDDMPPLVAVGFKRWRMGGEMEDVEKLGLQDVIHFPGFVSDDELRALYSACQAFIFPSLYEGFGLVALEAMACGAPVITSDRGGTADIGRDGAALLVDPFDETAIADVMERVMDDPDLHARLSENGLARAQDFSWDRMAEGFRSLISSIVANAGPQRR